MSISVNYESPKVIPDLKKLTYNDIYELNNTELINNEGVFLFKLKIDNEENGIIKLKIDKEAYPDKEMEIYIHHIQNYLTL